MAVVTRDSAIPLLTSVVCVLITSTIRGHAAEVSLDEADGLKHDSAANCDNLFTLPKSLLKRRRGQIGAQKLADLDNALAIALGLPSA